MNLTTVAVTRKIPSLLAGLALACGLAASPSPALSQQVSITHCQGACPAYRSSFTARNSRIVVHHLYAAGLNNYSRRADWVAYRLTPEAVGVASLLPRDWQPDQLADFPDISQLSDLAELDPKDNLPDISSAANTYGGPSVPVVEEMGRVHLVPLTSFAKTPYWPELNYVSNLLPMPAALRQGAWLRLEQRLNTLAKTEQDLHVVAGPVFFNGTAPGSAALKPGANLAAYFKVVATEAGTAAFLFPHDLRQTESYCGRLTSLEELESLTDLEFFPGERKAESWRLLEALGCPQPDAP